MMEDIHSLPSLDEMHALELRLFSAYHAMNNTDSGIGTLDLRGNITYANRALCSILGAQTEQEILGRNLDLWFDEASLIHPMLQQVTDLKPWASEQNILYKGASKWLRLSAVPDLYEATHDLRGIVISLQDTEERHRAELAEAQIERNRVMMESLGTICHAIGQPATVLLSSIEFLKLGIADEATQKDMLNLCYDAILELRDLLKQLSAKRKYATEAYIPGNQQFNDILAIDATASKE